jgi:hypothetical protein
MTMKIWGADTIVSNEVWVGSDQVRALSVKSLDTWIRTAQTANNSTVDTITTLEQRMEQSDRQLSELKKWVQGSVTFLEFMVQRYPDAVKEFNQVESTKMRVADTKECFHIVEKE